MSRKKINIKLYIIIIIIVFMLLYVFQKYYGQINVDIVSVSTMEDIVKADGFVVKDEYVIKAPSSGQTKCYYDEGEKVYKDLAIAELATTNSTGDIDNEIALINSELDKRKNENDSDNIITIGNTEKGKYSTYTNSELKGMISNLEKAKTTNKIPFYSPVSGLLTYTFDGLENMLTFDSVNSVTSDMLSQIAFNEVNYTDLSRKVDGGDPIIKVINNFFYYVVCSVPNDKLQYFAENSYVKLRFDDDEVNVYGYITKINSGENSSVLVISFNDFFYKVYNKRRVTLNIITDVHEGIKIHKSSLIEKNGLSGVYIKDISNIIKFLPVEILSSDEEYYILSQGETVNSGDRGLITIGESVYSTVKAFDKVVLDTDKVYEGQIVD